jgi:hypothetical protein
VFQALNVNEFRFVPSMAGKKNLLGLVNLDDRFIGPPRVFADVSNRDSQILIGRQLGRGV